ncbi:MAG: DUF4886 domain-containing protein [Lentisphaeria bacterium]|nr:DUF4886 domain-containing protein [Lentisphaeria bacterium]
MRSHLKIILLGLLTVAMIVPLGAKELKVLMIGNSFSVCVGKNLPQVVRSVPGNSLILTSAQIGGCPLDKHSDNLVKSEKDPAFKPYSITVWDSKNPDKQKNRKGSLNELLKQNQYDIVTIQQASRKSWQYDTYQPAADAVIAYIRKHQPKAEIVIQQTWAYRTDSPSLKAWKIDQDKMYAGLRDAYAKLAAKYRFRVIPTGDAVQLFRKYTPVKYQPSEGKFESPNVPSNAGDVVGASFWRPDKKTGKIALVTDYAHLNPDGHYLQACLWFTFLYGEPVEKIAFTPKGMDKAKAALLRKCAQEALDNYKQVK